MIIKQEVKLELERIDFVENPSNMRGQFIAYQFNMFWPLSSAFFNERWPLHSEKDMTVVWGSSPKITYYCKDNNKKFKNIVENKVKVDLLKDTKWQNLQYRLAFGFDSSQDDRPWCIYYSAEKYKRDGTKKTRSVIDGVIHLDKEFMSSVVSLIPKKINSMFAPPSARD